LLHSLHSEMSIGVDIKVVINEIIALHIYTFLRTLCVAVTRSSPRSTNYPIGCYSYTKLMPTEQIKSNQIIKSMI
jgi:hypothetical protein